MVMHTVPSPLLRLMFSFDFLNDQKLIGTLASISEGAQGGYSVASNNDGSIVVIGSPKENGPGAVYVYQFVNDAWVSVGSTINGSNSHERFGHADDINAQGKRIAIYKWKILCC